MTLTESIVKETALERFRDLSYALGHGPDIAPGEGVAERDWFEEGDDAGASACGPAANQSHDSR